MIDVSGVVHGDVIAAPKQTEAVQMTKVAHKAKAPPRGLVVDSDGAICGSPAIAVSPKHAGVECKKKEYRNRFSFEPRGRTLSIGDDGIVHEALGNSTVCADSNGIIHAADVTMCPKSPVHVARLKDAHKRRSATASEVLCGKLD